MGNMKPLVLAIFVIVILGGVAVFYTLGRSSDLPGTATSLESSSAVNHQVDRGHHEGHLSRTLSQVREAILENTRLGSNLDPAVAQERLIALLKAEEHSVLEVISSLEDPVIEGEFPHEELTYDFGLLGSTLGKFYATEKGSFSELFERMSPALENFKVISPTLNTFVNNVDEERLQQVADWVAQDPDEEFRYFISSTLGAVISSQDFDQAVEVYHSFSQGRTSANYLTGLVMKHAQSDPGKIGLFLKSLPDSPDLDQAVSIYVDDVAVVDPPIAMEWAMKIKDPDSRGFAIDRVSRVWKRSNPQVFERWELETQQKQN